MKKAFLTLYGLTRWLILILLLVVGLVFVAIEFPKTVLTLAKSPLEQQGISYGEIEGGILSGFMLKDVNYQDKIKAKEVRLKVDFKALEKRILYIDNVLVDGLYLDKDFLATMIDTNSSEEANESSEKLNLPFDQVIVNKADISLKNLNYQTYSIDTAQLHVSNLKTDMLKEHEGEVTFALNGNMGKVDLEAQFKEEKYNLHANIEGEKSFLAPFIAEHNVTLLSNPQFVVETKGDLKALEYNLTTKHLELQQNTYRVSSKVLNAFGHYDIEKNNLESTVKTDLDANVAKLQLDAHAKLNLDDLNNTLLFKSNLKLEPKAQLIKNELKEYDLTIEALPLMTLFAEGDMKKVDFSTNIKGLKVKQNRLSLDLKSLEIDGETKPLQGDTKVTASTQFNSSVADGVVHLKTALNFNDLNNTLAFESDANLKAHSAYINPFLKESNVTLQGEIPITISAVGDMKKVDFSTTLKGLNAKQNELSLSVKTLEINGDTKPLQGDTKVTALTQFNSSIADGEVHLKTALNFNDLNNTLALESDATLKAHSAYINPLLKDANLTVKGETPIALEAVGNMKALTLKVDTSSTLLKEKISSKLLLKSEPIMVNLQTHQVKGALDFYSNAKNMDLKLKTNFSGDYTKIEKLESQSHIEVNHFNAFGANLETLTPLVLNLKNNTQGVVLKLDSKKITMNATSPDYDAFKFDIKTAEIYPAKIVEVPEELKEKFVKLNLTGDAQVSKHYFGLKGFLESNKQFKLAVDAHNNAQGLDVNLGTQHLKVQAQGNVEGKNIDATVNIDSLAKLQEELLGLYPFTPAPVDGAVALNAKLRGEAISFALDAPKLKLEGFNIEGLKVDGDYNKDLITLNTLKFDTTGFKDARLNKAFYLNQKGKIQLGEHREVFIDMSPKILIKAQGTAEHLEGDFSIESLSLGYPAYGSTELSTQIHYEQNANKKKIVGGISLDKLQVSYEAKFLDAAHDPDVVVITKKDKNKKKESDTFLEDTFIDIAIYAPNAEYKTRDIDLALTVDLKAKKPFGKSLGLWGRVRDINGRVEQAPKLFTVVDSSIVFRGLKEINPILDIEVEHQLTDVLITINIHGDANHPKLEFSSDPVMPKKDILSYLLLGVSTSKISEGEGSLGREAQLFIMNQAARDFAYELELDRVFIKDDGTGEGYAVQAGKKVGKKTMAVIEGSAEGNSYILEYDVNKNIKVELGQHQKTVPSQSLDIFFRKKFK